MAKNNENIYAKTIARAWKDPQFKAKLLKNPKAALEEMGVKLDPKMQVKVVEDSQNSVTFVLPSQPTGAKELSEKELGQIAAGSGLVGLVGKFTFTCRWP